MRGIACVDLRGGRLKGKGKVVLVARETQGPGRARSLFARTSRFSRALNLSNACHVGYEGNGFEAVYSRHGLLARYI